MFGSAVTKRLNEMMKEKRISVIMNCQIKKMQGETKLEKIMFRKEEDLDEDKEYSEEGVTDYFLTPDVVIVEDGLGDPKMDIMDLVERQEAGNLDNIGIDEASRMPAANIRFGLQHNDIASPILAAGSCTQFPSFMHKIRIRTDDIKYNIEAGFYAAMNMLDK